MVHLGTADTIDPVWEVTPFGDRPIPPRHAVLIVRDTDRNNDYLDAVCEFLDIGVEHATTRDDLGRLLSGLRPMAVIADLESAVQDGFHLMKTTANYDRSLPILLLEGNDQALLGAVDAVREVWELNHVTTVTGEGGVGALVDFICHAARDRGMSGLMRV